MIRAALAQLARWIRSDDRRRQHEQAVECLPYDGRDRDRVEVYAGYGLADDMLHVGRV
jgi:hypothetical protein